MATAEDARAMLIPEPDFVIGINNRNLKTFQTSEAVTLELAENVPDRERLVAESGLHSADAIRRLWSRGIRRYLVGEAFVTAPSPVAKVREFVRACA
jgi:indole-3-glycerol phosphate synthase